MAENKKAFVMNVLKNIGGGIGADVALDLIEDKLIPRLPDNVKNNLPKQTAPALVLALALGAEYYMLGKPKLKQYAGIGMGAATIAGTELTRMLVPGLSGAIGEIIDDPLRRTNRTIPYTTQISK